MKGWTAVHFAAAFAPKKFEIMKVFAKIGAKFDQLNHQGQSLLSLLCKSDDTDPKTLEFVLERCSGVNVNARMKYQSLSSLIEHTAVLLRYRMGIRASNHLKTQANDLGSTALQHAVSRGDLEIVETLLKHGARVDIKNKLGKTMMSYCGAFPEIKGAIQRHLQSLKLGSGKTRLAKISFSTLQRRTSTHALNSYGMYLLSVSNLIRMYGVVCVRAQLCFRTRRDSYSLSRVIHITKKKLTLTPQKARELRERRCFVLSKHTSRSSFESTKLISGAHRESSHELSRVVRVT